MKFKILKKRKVAIIALLTLLMLVGISQTLYHRLSGKSQPKGAEALAVQTVRAKTLSMPLSIETVGSLFSLREAKLKASGPGKIERIMVGSGALVNKGTQLINIVGGADVSAPFAGRLTDWKVKVGEYVSAGMELVDLVDTSLLSLQYRVTEHYVSQLQTGQEVGLAVKAFPNRVFKGTVTYISPVIDQKTHTILVHAEIKNNQDLWPGMTVRVSHILTEDLQALVVPESTLLLTLDGYELLVVREGKLVRCPVQIGARNQGRAQVLSGVKPGESVLLTHTEEAKEGVAVVAHDWSGAW